MPEPVLMAIAAAIASGASTSLYELIKKKFSNHPPGTDALERARTDKSSSEAVNSLAQELEAAEKADPSFAEELRSVWNSSPSAQAENGGITNQVTGNISGNVVQARDIEGGVSF